MKLSLIAAIVLMTTSAHALNIRYVCDALETAPITPFPGPATMVPLRVKSAVTVGAQPRTLQYTQDQVAATKPYTFQVVDGEAITIEFSSLTPNVDYTLSVVPSVRSKGKSQAKAQDLLVGASAQSLNSVDGSVSLNLQPTPGRQATVQCRPVR